MYRTGLNIYKQNLIIGIGLKNFRVECSNQKYAFNDRSCSTHPHNLAIQLLAETGTVGFFFYICTIFLIVKILFKNTTNILLSKKTKKLYYMLNLLFFSFTLALFSIRKFF